MRKKVIMMIAVLALSITACGPMYEYRDLDGMWQLRQIVYYTDGIGNQIESKSEQLGNLYFSFQKHIINVRRIGYRNTLWGTFRYTDDSLHVSIQYSKYKHPDETRDPKVVMKEYGMNDTIQHFRLEKADGSKLILKSDYARLEFRDY